MNVGIIGYGSMGKMLLEAFSETGTVPGEHLYISNRTAAKLEGIAVPCQIAENNSVLAAQSDIIFLCVRPQELAAVLHEIAPDVKETALVVSLNGSISIAQIMQLLPRKTAKVIPSVTAEIRRSQTLLCCGETVTESDRDALENLLSCLGDVIELPETELGMGAELVSCMPGFIAAVFDVLCNAAMPHTKLPREQVVQMVLQTLCATGSLMLEKGLSFADVVSRVATKGGITEEGTKVISAQFPETAEQLFAKTLEKRRITAGKAAEYGFPCISQSEHE